MTKIVVLGAGIGGVPMAFELKELLGKKAEIAVVSQTDYFQFVPSNPWVAVNWRKPGDVKVSLPEVFKKLKIAFTPVGAKRVKPEQNMVELNDGVMLPCNVVVQEKEGGEVDVAAIDPRAAMRGIGNLALAEIAEEVAERLSRVVAAV